MMRQSSPSPCYLASSKLEEAPDTPECCASILNSLEKGTNRNLMTFSTGKHKVTNLNVNQHYCKEVHWYPLLNYKKYCQQVVGGNPPHFFSGGENTPGSLCPVVGFPVQVRTG